MADVKSVFQSKTVWVNVIALFAALAASMGLDILADVEAQGEVVAAVMAVVNIMLRLSTNKGLK